MIEIAIGFHVLLFLLYLGMLWMAYKDWVATWTVTRIDGSVVRVRLSLFRREYEEAEGG